MSLTAPNTGVNSLTSSFGLSITSLPLFAGFLAMLLQATLFDPDYYWHIETGRWIVVHGTLPSTDLFSFTHPDQPWVLHEWLFEVMLYGVFAAFGSFGVKFFSALMGTCVAVLLYLTIKLVLKRPMAAAWLACLAYVGLVLSPRPQLATYVFVGAYFFILVSLKYARSARLLPLLPIIMIVWVNAHGGYVIGIVLLITFCIAEWLNAYVMGEYGKTARDLRRLTLMTLLTILASLCNPYFISHWVYPFALMGMQANAFISEWQSPNFHKLSGRLFLLVVAIFCLLQIYRARKPDITELVVPGLFIVAGFTSIRHFVLALMAMSIFAAPALRDGIQFPGRLPAPVARLAAAWRARATNSKQIGRAEGPINLAIAAMLTLAMAAYYPTARAREMERINASLPVGAVQFILDKGITGRMFNNYGFGGYLIHRLYPQQRVFIDGRSDMYGDAFVAEYITISEGQPRWAELFDKYQIDFVVSTPTAPIRQLLLTRGDFRLVFQDEASSILIKDEPRFAALPTIASE
jgi:hypothetical protein